VKRRADSRSPQRRDRKRDRDRPRNESQRKERERERERESKAAEKKGDSSHQGNPMMDEWNMMKQFGKAYGSNDGVDLQNLTASGPDVSLPPGVPPDAPPLPPGAPPPPAPLPGHSNGDAVTITKHVVKVEEKEKAKAKVRTSLVFDGNVLHKALRKQLGGQLPVNIQDVVKRLKNAMNMSKEASDKGNVSSTEEEELNPDFDRRMRKKKQERDRKRAMRRKSLQQQRKRHKNH